jgi:hypothetical protein
MKPRKEGVTVRRLFCKFCGAKLRRDPHGQYCPTHNCQWQHGLPKDEDTKKKL